MKKVLLLPGWMTALRLYKNDVDDFDVYFGGLDEKSFSADYVVGLSLGAIIALYNIEKIKGKVILVNPPLPKRSLFRWLIKWVKYMVEEGLFLKRQKLTINPIRYTKALITCIKLLSVDFSNILDNVPKDFFISSKVVISEIGLSGLRLITLGNLNANPDEYVDEVCISSYITSTIIFGFTSTFFPELLIVNFFSSFVR